jgi:DNA-binding NarL/FixJ family response regulator
VIAPVRVVIVDDHPSFRRAARQLFGALGFAVLGEADCGAAAHALVRHCAPDLVVLDVLLGDECGFDVARALMDAHPWLTVVLTSVNADLADPDRIAGSGATAFLAKADLASLASPH